MIREAEARDAACIEGLYRELLPDHAGTKVLAERIEEIRCHEHSFLFVYEVQDQIVGTAHLHICLMLSQEIDRLVWWRGLLFLTRCGARDMVQN